MLIICSLLSSLLIPKALVFTGITVTCHVSKVTLLSVYIVTNVTPDLFRSKMRCNSCSQ